MKVLSLFDGMSCGQIALNRAGIKVSKYYASEVDKYAIQVTQANYPDTIQLGDITEIKGADLPTIDLLIGGSPCQGFSFAGKQLNFKDPRSKLFFEYVRILKAVQPKYFLLENVKMKQEYQDVITEALGVKPITINSVLVSAQNRVRLYWTNIPNVVQPRDKQVVWGDVREDGVNEQAFYYTEAALQWLARNSRKRGVTLDIHTDREKMQMLEASHYKKYSQQRFFGVVDIPSSEQVVAAMRGRYILDNKRVDGQGKTEQYIEFRFDKKSNCLSTVGKDNIIVPFTLPGRIPARQFFFRYITPTECERLQTVPDGYTDHVSNTQRYKMLGNGWTVDVLVHIFSGVNNETS